MHIKKSELNERKKNLKCLSAVIILDTVRLHVLERKMEK